MKKILITGKNSYVGQSLIKWLNQWPEQFEIEAISVRGDEWEKFDFSGYDSVLHLAGIAHVSSNPKMEDLYYKVNCDLTISVAKKAKASGVKQFIFMSSLKVYGDSPSKDGLIEFNTTPSPSDYYGKSKLNAENGILSLESDQFRIAIIRPPMIYGKDSKGNYPRLAKIARKLPIFPKINNERSMLHIDNLTEFIKFLITNEDTGLFFPQNIEYVNTSEMVKIISKVHGRNIKLVGLFNPLILPFVNKVGTLHKVFGNLIYDKSMSKYKESYQIRNLEESIKLTEQ